MGTIELEVQPRSILGKKVKRLRREGLTPVNVFGHGIPSAAMQVETRSLARALSASGKSTLLNLVSPLQQPRTVLVRDVQRDPRTHGFLHVDFYQVNLAEKIRMDVPLHFVGEIDNSLKAGALIHPLNAIAVECLPQDMLRTIEVELGRIDGFNKPLHVRDLVLPSSVAVLNDPDEVVAFVEPPRVAEEVEEAAAPAPAAEEKAAKEEA